MKGQDSDAAAPLDQASGSPEGRRSWGLLRRRECVVPTWRGWAALVLGAIVAGFLSVRCAYPFLAVNDPLPGGILVVEGWAPDQDLAAALEEFRRNRYEKVVVTGGPLSSGAFLIQYKTYAEQGQASLLKLGLTSNQVEAVPAPFVRQDRTYASAVALRKWLDRRSEPVTKVHLVTEGPHARRSRLMFAKACGDGVAVGVTAVPPLDYDPRCWWRSSAGVRSVLSEALAYAYARLFFRAADG